ncbi:MFS general substrate transporter [Cryphonectria parasitica EP155]|uniref:MFS general substrate transporter n=1 Tax=Cryphonectria parasitica (strain ATCC 38755 / EP155) TaxID=660469 RepID=A0A9P4Y824_CRYP1|nr:MFS general substrate transporter [Cryphonectria parasitica EP155]KAF3768072.1 MFS general substrate transporter [Cryphonectria parasitica EP155]
MPTSDESGNGTSTEDDDNNNNNDAFSQRSQPVLAISKAKAIALVATVTGASFLNTLSIQAVVIILPTIGRDLSIPDSRQQWIVSAYSLTFGCFLLLWGRIADVYGKRTIFVLGSAWVAITTAVNPVIPNEIAFDLFRGLQGLGAAANVPTAIGILGTTFPPGRAKNYAFSTYAAGAPMGSICGNLLGGLIASYAHWTWVFWALAILAVAVTVAGYFVIPPPVVTPHAQGVTAKATIDWVGAILITAGLMILLFALTEGNVVGWSTPWVPVLIVVSLILVVIFVLWQRHLENKGTQTPLMKVSIFKNRRFSAAMVIMGLFFACFNGYLIFATYYFQDYQGLSPIQTTLRFIPTGVVGVLTAAITGKLIAVLPTQGLLLFGNLCCSISCLLFAVPIPAATTTYFAYGLPAMVLSVLGADTAWPCLTLFTSHSLPQADQAMGGALVNAVGQFGRAIGLAVATAVQTAVMAHDRHTSVAHSGSLETWDRPTLKGLQAAQYLNFAFGATSLCVVAVAFRGTGVIGRAGLLTTIYPEVSVDRW